MAAGAAGAPPSHRDPRIMIAAIIRTSTFVKLALLGFVIGLGFIGYGQLGAPVAQDRLQSLEASVASASRVSRTSRRSGSSSAHYTMMLRPGPAGAAEFEISIPAIEAAESQIRGAVGQRVRIDYAAADDVYGLAVAGKPVITYANTAERRRLGLRQHQVDGVAILGGSLVVLLVSGGLAWRRLHRQAAA